MSPRYLVVAGHCANGADAFLAQLAQRTGLEPKFAVPGLAALANDACGCVAVGDHGCILGWLFRRHGPAEQVAALAPAETAAITASNGDALFASFWGGYVAAFCGTGPTRILRDPSGTFSCYFARSSGLTLFASDADLLVESGIDQGEVDLEEVGRTLYRSLVPVPATALGGISELLAGFALDPSDEGSTQSACWSPWDHVAEPSESEDDLAERLSRIVDHSIAAWASTRRHHLLSVSGGLDSSIVAASMARAGAATTCLTMFTEDPAGDERHFARALCERLGLRLIERAYRLEDVELDRPLAPHLPRPRDRLQALAYERVNLEVAKAVGADAFMTGNGGDHIFGFSQSAAPLADLCLAKGLGRAALATLLDICRQTGCSVFDAAGQAWRLARTRRYEVRPKPLLLNPAFVAGLDPAELSHPWLNAPAGALPGKAAHVATILRVQPCIEASRGAELPVFSPLLSQPIVEACLAVPSWTWRRDGRDRALARRAFASRLPREVLDRRVKGTPSRFAASVLDHLRGPIRDRLLGGRLAGSRIIDTAAIEALLEGERPVPDLERVRILELVNAEAWIAHWAGRKRLSEFPEPEAEGSAMLV